MKIGVLIASFNGELFIKEQINSILNQRGSHEIYKIVVTDDGSSDKTLDIVREFPFIKVTCNNSGVKGPAANFVHGLKELMDCDFVFFSDQDDIWRDDKIDLFCLASTRLNKEYPGLVYSGLELVNSFGKSLNVSFHDHESIPIDWSSKISHIFLQNCAPGCAMMINNKMANRIVSTFCDKVIMHDWWAMLFAVTYSNLSIINDKTVYYRQHSANAVGASKKISLSDIPKVLRKSRRNLYLTLSQILYFKKILTVSELNMLTLNDIETLNRLCDLTETSSFSSKVKVFFRISKFKSSLHKDFITRIMFFFI